MTLTKRQWVILQQALTMYADSVRYNFTDEYWDEHADGYPPSGGEIDRLVVELSEQLSLIPSPAGLGPAERSEA